MLSVFMTPIDYSPTARLVTFSKPTLEKGVPAQVECVDVEGQTYAIARQGPVTVVGLEDDWYEDVRDPAAVIAALKANPQLKADVFTFWQRMPDTEPRHHFHTEWEEIAVLHIKSYDHWLKTQIKSRVRNLVRKAQKEGIEVREIVYDDAFVHGMTTIFNEAPIRQGRKFWHYGKDFATIKEQFSRYIHREHMLGAYLNGEMIGFIMLGNAGRFGLTGQIISSLKHRDKATNNALIAKAVEFCAQQGLEYLIYLYWSEDSLAEFKRRCGFEKTRVPRYFVPLTAKGRFAVKCGAHRGWKQMVPARLKSLLKRLRRMWHGRRAAAE
ncbi:hypothetical protein AYO49_05990 [Verrucomicrobiaceae bacterium SCGC AG-212-N21]|nr:hypothetical protein AYO49_05990 [Verrucomicrobiaceae bacterium SCGC AG-212-N21]